MGLRLSTLSSVRRTQGRGCGGKNPVATRMKFARRLGGGCLQQRPPSYQLAPPGPQGGARVPGVRRYQLTPAVLDDVDRAVALYEFVAYGRGSLHLGEDGRRVEGTQLVHELGTTLALLEEVNETLFGEALIFEYLGLARLPGQGGEHPSPLLGRLRVLASLQFVAQVRKQIFEEAPLFLGQGALAQIHTPLACVNCIGYGGKRVRDPGGLWPAKSVIEVAPVEALGAVSQGVHLLL